MKHSTLVIFLLFGLVSFILARDQNALTLSITPDRNQFPIEFLVTDPLGRRCGQQNINGPYVFEIPDTSCGKELPLPGIEIGTLEYYSGPAKAGMYTLTVYGFKTSTYSLDVLGYDSSGKPNSAHPHIFNDVVKSAHTSQYKIHFDPVAGGGRTEFEKVLSWEVVRQDLEAVRELKGIKREELFRELLGKLRKAEKQPLSNQKKFLETLLREIKSYSVGEIHPQLSVILQQDLTALLKTLK